MKTVPYTTSTGIKIGSRWNESPKPMAIDDVDMIRIQEALLATPEYIQSKRMYNLITVLSTLVAVFLCFSYFLFN
jgi:hypothetical protein